MMLIICDTKCRVVLYVWKLQIVKSSEFYGRAIKCFIYSYVASKYEVAFFT
jgi:hypothetical protein